MYLIKNKSGLYSPMDESDFEQSKGVGVGSVVKATKARNWKFHKKAFALMKIGFENQDRYETMEVYRKVITIRAGYFDTAPTKDGEEYYFAKSLSFDNMGASEFEKWYECTLNIISKDMETQPDIIRNELNGFY